MIWHKTDDHNSMPLSTLLERENLTYKILCIRRGSREVFVWDYTETDFKRIVLAWALISVPKELRP